MKIQINGLEQEVSDDTTITMLLDDYKLERQTVIVELNKTLLDTEATIDQPLKNGDVIEFVRFVGGG